MNISLKFKSMLLMLLAALLMFSCSNDSEDKVEQRENYESQSTQIGHEAAKSIKVPMENAQDMVDMENKRMQEYEKKLSE